MGSKKIGYGVNILVLCVIKKFFYRIGKIFIFIEHYETFIFNNVGKSQCGKQVCFFLRLNEA